MENATIREAILPEPRAVLTLIKEGTAPAPKTEKQRAYKNAKSIVFTPQVELTKERVKDLLTTKKSELEEAISQSPLKGATDRNGYTLGSLLDLTDLAVQELDGKLQAKTVLRRVLEMVTDEREREITDNAKDKTREGLVIDRKTGSIYLQSFPSPNAREVASSIAQNNKADFLKAKERLQRFASELK